MIYITGDTHRDFENVIEFCHLHNTTIDDVLIILGDVGLNYYLDSSDNKVKKRVAELPITLFCVRGLDLLHYVFLGYREHRGI